MSRKTPIVPGAADASLDTSPTTATCGTKAPPILVTLNSRPLMLEIVHDKAKTGQLHTAEFANLLPQNVDRSKLGDLINVNEFLPRETHVLHMQVRRRAKQAGSGFVSYTRNGQIFVRRRKGDVGTPVNSISDLDNFLGL